MKCNDRELAQLSDLPCVIEGRLNYRRISNGSYRGQSVFKERWFRLVNNYLFYFKLSDLGKFDSKCPAGVFVLENSSIQMEHGHNISFAFSISFIDEAEKRHLFAARSEENVIQWVTQLRACPYEYLRGRLHTLQSKIYSMTGKDPLLLVPRNEGAKLWAPSVPFSTAPACTVRTSSFSCHLHTNGAFTLERSHSACVLAPSKEKSPKEKHKNNNDYIEAHGLERSKTSAAFQSKLHPLNNAIFASQPLFTRPAPSPPVRKKSSPRFQREVPSLSLESKGFAELSKHLATTSILDEAPVPPRRKVSPRSLDVNSSNDNNEVSSSSKVTNTKDEDLIRF